MWSVNHSFIVLSSFMRELNLMCMQIWNIRRTLDRWYLRRFFYKIPRHHSDPASQRRQLSVVCLPKLSSLCKNCRQMVLVRGVGPDQSEARDDTRLCPGPHFWPQIAPQLPAWRRGKCGRMRPSPVRVIRYSGGERIISFWLVIMTISWPLIGQMEWCIHCGMGKGGRGGEWKCRECTEAGVPCTCLIIAVTRRGSLPGLPWPRGSLPFLETALRPTWYFPPLSLCSDHRDSAVNRKHISHEASGDHRY